MKCLNFKQIQNHLSLIKTEYKLCNNHTAQCGVDLIRTSRDAGFSLIRTPRDAVFIRRGHHGLERVMREIDQKISICDENVRGLLRNRQNPRGA